MKRTNLLKKSAILFLLFCMISVSSYYSMPATTVSASTIQPLSDNIGWVYKKINGKYYKCLYNFTTHTWIGNWIPVNS